MTIIMENYSDKTERHLIIKFFAIIGVVATATMATLALYNNNYLLMLVISISTLLFASSLMIKQKANLSSAIVLYTLYTLMLYLVVSGGTNGTGPIWVFVVSPVTFFLQGLKRGILDILLFTTAMIGAFYFSNLLNLYHYTLLEFPIRVVLSFVIVALLSGFYEYFRDSYSKKLISLAKKNELLATIDPLTNLPNRRSTMQQLNYEKSKINRSQQVFSIMLSDVDDFKQINDKLGHQAGDQALLHLANILNNSIREQDIVARWGGEEFLFMLPNTNKESALLLSEKIHQKLKSNPFEINGISLPITLSTGICEVNNNRNLDLDIQEADNLMYQAKSMGKDRTVINEISVVA